MIITHNVSQIDPRDFVYILKGGMVVEQGLWYDLGAEPAWKYQLSSLSVLMILVVGHERMFLSVMSLSL
jgi:ABC-type dipeptide/oligopeptide/nickel transport system ATPase component